MIIKRLIPIILISIAIFVGLTAYGEFRSVSNNLLSFPIQYFLLALTLAITNYLLRYIRWNYYLEILNTKVPAKTSILVFFSGLAMSLTPGKVGELSKVILLRNHAQVPIAITTPVIIMERVTDLLAIALLSLGALILFIPFGTVFAFIGIFLLTITVLLISQHSGRGWFAKLNFVQKRFPNLKISLDTLADISTPKVLLKTLTISTMAWLSEGLSLWIIIQGLDLSLSPTTAITVYATATLVGAFTLIPGGLGGTEGSMALFLIQLGLPRGGASSATMIVRLCTLWFAVFLGLISLLWLQRISMSKRPLDEI